MLPKNVTEYISRSLCQNAFLDMIRTFSLINIICFHAFKHIKKKIKFVQTFFTGNTQNPKINTVQVEYLISKTLYNQYENCVVAFRHKLCLATQPLV